MYDEHVLREMVAEVKRGRLGRRAFINAMVAAGLTAPMAAQMLPAKPAEAAPARRPRRAGGTLKLLWWQAASHANTHLSTGTKDSDASQVFHEPLANFDTDGNIIPALAERAPSRENEDLSPDGKTVIWRLKKGVTWHDGKPFTAEDVVFTWEYVADPATASVSAGVYKNIDRVEKMDDHTVKVVYKEPTAAWFNAYVGPRGHIFAKHAVGEYKGQNARNSPYNQKPVGTGPYKVVDFKVEDVIIAEKNPNYHRPGLPTFDRLELKGGGDATSAVRAVMQTGEYDYAWNAQVEWEVLRSFERFGKGKILAYPGASVERVLVNFTDPWTEVDGERSSLQKPHPFQTDIRVRRAFALAMDRKGIVDELYGVTGFIGLNTLGGPTAYYSPNTSWELNIDKANALLDEAGWSRGTDGIRAKDGVKMRVVYQTSTNSVRQKTQAIVKAGLEKIGVECELKSVDGGVFFNNDPGNLDNYPHFSTDLQMYTSGPSSPDAAEFMLAHYGPEAAQKANQWRGRNIERWQSAEYDAAFKAADAELDPVKRAAGFIKCNDLAIENFVCIPLVQRAGVAAANIKLKNTNLSTWDSNLWNLAAWEME